MDKRSSKKHSVKKFVLNFPDLGISVVTVALYNDENMHKQQLNKHSLLPSRQQKQNRLRTQDYVALKRNLSML